MYSLTAIIQKYECCNWPIRKKYSRKQHNQLCTDVSGDRWDFMLLYRKVTVLCTLTTFSSTYYSSQNKRCKPLMHKSSHNRPKDYVYHSIRDAALSGIVRSETPALVSVCFGSLGVDQEQHDHSNTCWRPWALGIIQRLKSSRMRARDVQRQKRLTVKKMKLLMLIRI